MRPVRLPVPQAHAEVVESRRRESLGGTLRTRFSTKSSFLPQRLTQRKIWLPASPGLPAVRLALGRHPSTVQIFSTMNHATYDKSLTSRFSGAGLVQRLRGDGRRQRRLHGRRCVFGTCVLRLSRLAWILWRAVFVWRAAVWLWSVSRTVLRPAISVSAIVASRIPCLPPTIWVRTTLGHRPPFPPLGRIDLASEGGEHHAIAPRDSRDPCIVGMRDR